MIGQGVKDMNRVVEDDAVRIPIWMRNTLFGAVIALSASGVTTWAKTNDATTTNDRQDAEIAAIKSSMQILISTSAATHQEVRDMKDVQAQSAGKLDRILELQMAIARK